MACGALHVARRKVASAVATKMKGSALRRFRVRLLMGFAVAAGVGLGSQTRPAEGAEKPTALSEPRIAEQVEPGTVLIVHDEAAPISLAKVGYDYEALQPLQAADPEINRLLGVDPAAAVQKALERYVLPDPTRFFKVTSGRTIQASARFTGSGAIVRGDGYIVTNAHVVAPDDDTVRAALVDDVAGDLEADLEALLADISGDYITAGRRYAITLSSDAQKTLSDAYIRYVVGHSELGGRTSSTSVLSQMVRPAENTGMAAEIVELGRQYPDKDVAILKVQGSNLYTVPLGDDTDATSGSRVFAIGYPVAATFSPGAAEAAPLAPSISSGTVSARRTVDAGYSMIQHNAVIQAGSSGGPMVDETGRIVGLTTAGNTGENAGTFYYSVPVALIRELLARRNLEVGPSIVTTRFTAALNQFDHKRYKASLRQLEELDRTSPGLLFVTEKMTAARKKIDAGENVDESVVALRLVGTGAGVLIFLLLVAGCGLGLKAVKRSPVPRSTMPPGRKHATGGDPTLPVAGPPTWRAPAPPPGLPAHHGPPWSHAAASAARHPMPPPATTARPSRAWYEPENLSPRPAAPDGSEGSPPDNGGWWTTSGEPGSGVA